MDKIKFTLGKFSFPDFFATNCTVRPRRIYNGLKLGYAQGNK
jgi:hypothetical protein